jgi:MarR family 2-MHQ and catechol resistance regulon transcriptional repressor
MPNHYPGTPDEVRALDAYVKLARAASAVERSVNDHLADAALTPSQFGVLEALHHLGPLSQGVLARTILTSPGNLTTVLDKLEARGLLRRRRDRHDRRVVLARLTPTGEALVRDLMPRHVARVVTAFAALAPDQQAQLAALLRTLGLAQGDRAAVGGEAAPEPAVAAPAPADPPRKETP